MRTSDGTAPLMLIVAALPAPIQAQDVCRTLGPKHASAVLRDPVHGPITLADEPAPAKKGMVLASRTTTIEPKIVYLAAPVVLADETGSNLASGVPLGRGAPVSEWRYEDGTTRQCAIGWKKGLFGGATGDGHMRWVCFEDRDGDGAFDLAWRPHSKSLGLSFRRLDVQLPAPVAALAEPPADAEVKIHANAQLGHAEILRSIVVSKVTPASITLDSRARLGYSNRRLERVELPAGQAGSVTIAGITVALTPSAGGPLLSASGAFPDGEARLTCGNSNLVLGEISTATYFSFPNW